MAKWASTPNSSSADSHRADSTMVALMSYNIGLVNDEYFGQKFRKANGKYDRLKDDVQEAFANELGIQILLLSEFGHMFDKLPDVTKFFTVLLEELNLKHVHLEVAAPYVAMIDTNAWQVTKHESFFCRIILHTSVAVHTLLSSQVSEKLS